MGKGGGERGGKEAGRQRRNDTFTHIERTLIILMISFQDYIGSSQKSL